MENYQTLCASCNTKKSDTPDMSIQEAVAAGLTTQEIQDALAIVNEAREEFKQAEQKLQAAKAKFSELLPKRDKKEFI